MRSNTKKILSRLNELAEKHLGKSKVILYGSRARGTEDKHSDWDILILTETEKDKSELDAFLNDLYNLELELEEVFTPIIRCESVWNSAKYRVTPLYKNIQSEGIYYAG